MTTLSITALRIFRITSLGGITLNIKTLSILTLRIMTRSIPMLGITAFSIVTKLQ